MNNIAIAPARSFAASPESRHLIPNHATLDVATSDCTASRQSITSILDAVHVGFMLYAGHEVVYQSASAHRALQMRQDGPNDTEGPSRRGPGEAVTIEKALLETDWSDACRVIMVGAARSPLCAVAIPLVRLGIPERDITIVVLGNQRMCEGVCLATSGMLEKVEETLIEVVACPEPDRVLLTMLFTDIVDSTRCAEHVGDQQWHKLLDRYYTLIRRQLETFRGQEVDTAGDGFFAAFDAPARAVRCARAIRDAAQRIGLNIRVGLHTGECEVDGDKPTGVAVHVAARVAAIAGAGEILVSSTVKELVAGSGLRFSASRRRVLKGLQDPWRLFALSGSEA